MASYRRLRQKSIWWNGLALACLASMAYGAVEESAEKMLENRVTPTVRAVAKVMPSVVNIGTERVVKEAVFPTTKAGLTQEYFSRNSNWNRHYSARKTHSLGSGFIIDPAGLIITNSHVVYQATRIMVTLADGRTIEAREIASSDLEDIALLRLEGLAADERLNPIGLAVPDELLLGETVITVGNPYGLGNSISRGVLSAVNRKAVRGGEVIMSDLLQTDTAINPGNSGGPLVDINGNLIGVNIASYKRAEGIGFAVPLSRLEELLGKWLIPERFGNYSLGLIPGLRRDTGGTLQLVVAEVFADSPAWRAGLRRSDIIETVDGDPIHTLPELSARLWRMKPGDKISVGTSDGATRHIEVESINSSDGRSLAMIRLGLGVQELTPELATAMGYPFGQGVVISKNLGAPASVTRGEILARLGDMPIHGYGDIAKALWRLQAGDRIPAVFIGIGQSGQKYYLRKKVVELHVK